MEPKYLTIDQAAAILQVNPMTVRRWIKAGKLPAVTFQGLYRIDAAELESFMATPVTERKAAW